MTPTALRQLPGALPAILIDLSAPGGAVVMGTGIVAIGLALDGEPLISHILLGIATLAWLGLAASVLCKVHVKRAALLAESRQPVSLTAVAGTAVLGSGFTLLGWADVGGGLLAVAGLLFALLLIPVLSHWETPTVGSSFVLVVAIESLAVLAASLALVTKLAPLLYFSAGTWLVGLLAYSFVVFRFDFAQLLRGRGDHWVAGGALAIATLAVAEISRAAGTLLKPDLLGGSLRVAAIVLWATAIVWLLLLVLTELLHPRWGYDVLRWGTVFPVGMYACCSIVVGTVDRLGLLVGFGRVWIWVSLGIWIFGFGALLRRAASVISRQQRKHARAR